MRFAELLQIAPELSRFTDSIPEELDGQFTLLSYGPHALIHQKDSRLERIGILLKGSFRVVNEFENGNVFMIELNDAVSFTGEVTLLAGAATTSVTIETVSDCLVAFMPVAAFDAWLRRDIRLLRARPLGTTFTRQVHAAQSLYGPQLAWHFTIANLANALAEPLTFYAQRDAAYIAERAAVCIEMQQKKMKK